MAYNAPIGKDKHKYLLSTAEECNQQMIMTVESLIKDIEKLKEARGKPNLDVLYGRIAIISTHLANQSNAFSETRRLIEKAKE